MQVLREAVAEELFDLGAVKFGEFRLKLHERQPDAPLSPIYLNLRTRHHPSNPGPLADGLMEQIGVLMSEALKSARLNFDCIAGIPDAGDPFADQLMTHFLSSGIRYLWLHKEKRSDGTRHITDEIHGRFSASDRVVLLDDLITQADSKLEAIAALESHGLEVAAVLVLVDRQQGGKEELAQRGYNLMSVFTIDELITFYLAEGLLRQAKAQEVRLYIEANRR